MADTKGSALTNNTAPIGSDKLIMIDDPAGAPATQNLYLGDANALYDGFMLNGVISPAVASNNLTVTLKTRANGNPSATDPISVWLNGSFRRVTATTAITRLAGTNWANAGSAELATKEIDWFVYLIWDTFLATDAFCLGFSRYPHGRVYSDFSTTTTNEKYIAVPAANTPNTTDDVVLIGRFAATLSAGAGYTWSVPTFTNTNLVNRPIYETRWLTWTPAISPTGGSITTVGAVSGSYQVSGYTMELHESIAITNNGTGSGALVSTLPFTPSTGNQNLIGRNASTSVIDYALPATNTVQWYKYDGTYPIATGQTLVGGGRLRLV